MGLVRTNGHKNTTVQRMAVIAADIYPPPARPPFWVSQPGGNTPAQGWYWVPAGAVAPAFLGHNRHVAEANLFALAAAIT